MKKIILGTLIILFASTLPSNAQMKKGAYVGLNVGYNAAAGSANVDYLDITNKTNTPYNAPTTTIAEKLKFSYGKGVNAGFLFGYMFNKNFGAELGFNYLEGNKIYYHQDKDLSFSYYIANYDKVAFTYSKMFQLNPSFVVATSLKKATPYAKFGFVIGTGKIFKTIENEPTALAKSNRSLEYSGGLAIGYTAAMGLDFNVCKNISTFGEIHMITMQYSPQKGSITNEIFNNEDWLQRYSVSQKEFEFVKHYSYTLPTANSITSPSKQPSFSTPFSSIGLRVGVKFHL